MPGVSILLAWLALSAKHGLPDQVEGQKSRTGSTANMTLLPVEPAVRGTASRKLWTVGRLICRHLRRFNFTSPLAGIMGKPLGAND